MLIMACQDTDKLTKHLISTHHTDMSLYGVAHYTSVGRMEPRALRLVLKSETNLERTEVVRSYLQHN